jgi:glutathione synthase/RimK-type ligase-like ATP-grasp enzyme
METEKKYVTVKAKISDAKVTEPKEEDMEILESYLEYDLKPMYVGPTKIKFLNAQKPKFYLETYKRKNPIVKMWLLRKNNEFNYITKRFIEQAYAMDIHLDFLVMDDFEMVLTQEGENQLNYQGKQLTFQDLPQVCIPRFGATIDYFSLTILRQLEQFGVKMMNDVKSLEIAKDKLTTMQVFSNSKLPIPKTVYAKFPLDVSLISKTFVDFPIILKLASSSQGNGVMQIYNEDNLKDVSSNVLND